jgi:hypothetical protein
MSQVRNQDVVGSTPTAGSNFVGDVIGFESRSLHQTGRLVAKKSTATGNVQPHWVQFPAPTPIFRIYSLARQYIGYEKPRLLEAI